MKQIVLSLCCSTVIALTSSITLSAQEPAVLNSTELKPVDCTKEELMTFFPKPIVKDVLIQQKISAEQADAIALKLSGKDQELVKIVEEKASKLNPNPFKDLNQRDLAIKIYRETLYEVFANVLKDYQVTDEKQVHQLLDAIQQAKSKLFIECIRKQQETENKPASP